MTAWNTDLKPFKKWAHASADWKTQPMPMQGVPVDILRGVQQNYAKLKYIPDAVQDVWASPTEFQAAGGGDCEDFAISKYHDLLSKGFADDQMRIVVGRKKATGELHAVLTVADGGKTWVLDNQFPDSVMPGEHLDTIEQAYQINRTGWGR